MQTKNLSLNLFVVVALMALLTVNAFFTAPQAYAQVQPPKNQGNGIGVPVTVAKRIILPGGQNVNVQSKAKSKLVDTIPFWSSVFTYNGPPYPYPYSYQMVGTDPSVRSNTTVVSTAVIPLNLTFSNGITLKGDSKLKATLSSPIFKQATYTSGKTQYGDAIQRAAFWKYVSKSNKNYHVLLSTPRVYQTVNLTVPANMGNESVLSTGTSRGSVDISWFDAQLQSLMTQFHISPSTLPIFLNYNILLYTGTVTTITGYHNALFSTDALGKSVIQTYISTTYNDSGIFASPQIEDIDTLSHEVAEWYNDPFVDNFTPGWTLPNAPPQFCRYNLEVGDPLETTGFLINGYHLQDVAFFSWFAKQVPSIGINGQYTYLGTFTAPSPTC